MTDAGNRSRDMALVALFAALTAVGAFIRIPVPVVPFTLQFLFTNLAGLLLGAKRGAAAAGVYMAAGLIGVPVFTQGGGPWYVMNPTFGYIAGFAAGAWCAGKISRLRARRSFRLLLAASFANIAVVYLFGVVYYWFAASYFTGSHVAVSALLLYGVALAAPGDIALCFVSAALAAKILQRIGGGGL